MCFVISYFGVEQNRIFMAVWEHQKQIQELKKSKTDHMGGLSSFLEKTDLERSESDASQTKAQKRVLLQKLAEKRALEAVIEQDRISEEMKHVLKKRHMAKVGLVEGRFVGIVILWNI